MVALDAGWATRHRAGRAGVTVRVDVGAGGGLIVIVLWLVAVVMLLQTSLVLLGLARRGHGDDLLTD